MMGEADDGRGLGEWVTRQHYTLSSQVVHGPGLGRSNIKEIESQVRSDGQAQN
jgi:hypothetical protein